MDPLKVHALLSSLVIVTGGILLAYMVTVEGEPGAIPLLLLVVGVGWYVATRARIRRSARSSASEGPTRG